MTKIIAVCLALVACASLALAGEKVRKLEAREVAAMQSEGKTVLFVDVRNGDHPNKIPGAVNVPLAKIDEWAASTDPETLVVAYCACPSDGTSVRAVRRLQERGFANAYVLKDGLAAWYDLRRNPDH